MQISGNDTGKKVGCHAVCGALAAEVKIKEYVLVGLVWCSQFARVNGLLIAVPVVGSVHLTKRLNIANAGGSLLSPSRIGEVVDLTDERGEGRCVAPDEEYPAVVVWAVVGLGMRDGGSCFVRGRGEAGSVCERSSSGDCGVESMIRVMKLVSEEGGKLTGTGSRKESKVGGVEPMELLVRVSSANPYLRRAATLWPHVL